ncbi:MAG: hypothetical protein ABIO62_16370 [Paracoccaceae bacterium]
MNRLRKNLNLLLHASLMALLVLGMVLRPVLDVSAEINLAEHAVQFHAEGMVADANSTDCIADARVDKAHGLVHQDGSSFVCADLVQPLDLPLVVFGPVLAREPALTRVPAHHPATPFRPPTA